MLKVRYRLDARTEVATKGEEPGKPVSKYILQFGLHPDEPKVPALPPQFQIAEPPRELQSLPIGATVTLTIEPA